MRLSGNIRFASLVTAIFGFVAAAYFAVFSEERPGATPEVSDGPSGETAVRPVSSLRLVEADGAVEVQSSVGAWDVLEVGGVLQRGTVLRTVAGGKAALEDGDTLRLEVMPESHVHFEDAGDGVTRFTIREGLLITDVRGGDKPVEVRTAGSDAMASTRDGRLHVLADGDGGMRAAVTRGRASVRNAGEEVDLEVGFETTVKPGQAPTAPLAMPSSLLLKVRWPAERETSKRRHQLVGTTSPGARVRVGERYVHADDRGTFVVVIELAEGANKVRLQTMDIQGRVAESVSEPIRLHTKAPAHHVETHPDMWRKVSD